MSAIVELRHVSKRYGRTTVLDDVSLAVAEGDIVTIIGPSGAGKSSLLRIVNQLERHDAGELHVAGSLIDPDDRGARRAALRGHVGMVFQSFNLFPHLTAAGECHAWLPLLGLLQRLVEARSPRSGGDVVDARRPRHSHGPHAPSQLSGGQQQRVAIARALAMDPKPRAARRNPPRLVDPELVNEVLATVTRRWPPTG